MPWLHHNWASWIYKPQRAEIWRIPSPQSSDLSLAFFFFPFLSVIVDQKRHFNNAGLLAWSYLALPWLPRGQRQYPLHSCEPVATMWMYLSQQEHQDANLPKAQFLGPRPPAHPPLPTPMAGGWPRADHSLWLYQSPASRRKGSARKGSARHGAAQLHHTRTFFRALSPAALFSRPMYSLPSFSHMEATLREYRG